MIKYREAESLVVLREQMNKLCPHRDKSSDGWIGDSAHALRTSDHNPWVIDGKTGIVTAQDIDADLNSTNISIRSVIDAICLSQDNRVKYIIFAGRITAKHSALQQWLKYTGPNAHLHHMHISVFPDKALYDNTRLWKLT